MEISNIVTKVTLLYENQGIKGPVWAFFRRAHYYGVLHSTRILPYVWAKSFRARSFPAFSFRGRTYPYFYTARNFAWMSERTIEVPIVAPYLEQAYLENKRILEVGDVMRHYSRFKTHDIVDKYDYRQELINVDIEDFRPQQPYDLIVSISTLEHVGWDAPEVRDPAKILRTLRVITDLLLAPGGIAVITMPVGWNSDLDNQLRCNEIPFSERYFLKRVSKGNQWEETTADEALAKQYGTPFYCANAIVVGIIAAKK
jgi:hypothetical protein